MADESSRRSSRDASDRPKTRVTEEAQSSEFDVVQAMMREEKKGTFDHLKKKAKTTLRGMEDYLSDRFSKQRSKKLESTLREAQGEFYLREEAAKRRKDEAQAPFIEAERRYKQERHEKHVSLGENLLALRQEWLEKRKLYLAQKMNEDDFIYFQREYIENVKKSKDQILNNQDEYHRKIELLKDKKENYIEAQYSYDREIKAASEEYYEVEKKWEKARRPEPSEPSEPLASRPHREVGTAEKIEEIQKTRAWNSERVQNALKLLNRENPGYIGWEERVAGVLSEYIEAIQELSEREEKYSGAQEEMHSQNKGKGKAVEVEGNRQNHDKDKKDDVRDITKDLDAILLAMKNGGAIYEARRKELQKFDNEVTNTWSEINDIQLGLDPFRLSVLPGESRGRVRKKSEK